VEPNSKISTKEISYGPIRSHFKEERRGTPNLDPNNITKLMGELRQRTYCSLLSNNKEEKGAKIIKCTFDHNCGRNIKGKGNLR
jgi:hypothetical protein